MARTHARPNRPQLEGSAKARTELQTGAPAQARPGDWVLNHADVAALQRQVGNQAVQRLLRRPASVPRVASQTLRLQRAKFRPDGEILNNSSWDDDAVNEQGYSTDDTDGFASWLKDAQDIKLLSRVRKNLRSIKNPDHLEIIAISVVDSLIDQQEPDNYAPNPLGLLPKNKWWKLFIDKKLHQDNQNDLQNSLRFDRESSPGYYTAMITAFEKYLEGINPPSGVEPLDADQVIGMHERVTQGTMKKGENERFIPMPQGMSGQETSFGVTKDEDALPSLSGMREMIQSGVLGMHSEMAKGDAQALINPDDPRSQFRHKASQMTVSAEKQHIKFNSRLLALSTFQANTDYNQKEAPGKIQAFLHDYYGAMYDIEQDEFPSEKDRKKAQLREIVQLIRALHVSHFFQDANGRLNTMVLLNKFLLENGFSPVIMDDTAVFGGELSVDQLVGQVVRGMNTFNAEVGKNAVDINVDRDYSFFRFFVDNRPDDIRARILYVIELDLSKVPKGRLKAIQELLETAKISNSCFQTGWRGQLIYKLGFTKPEPAERLERTLEAFT